MKLGEAYRKLVDDDFRFLSFMVKKIKQFEYVPIEYIIKKFEHKFSQKEILARIKKLTRLRLLAKHPSIKAYRITFLGLDCISLRLLVAKNVVKAIGDIIGVGKESEVYRGLAENNDIVAIKFYKIGKQNFKHIAKYRGYYSDDVVHSGWLRRSIIAGKREKDVLEILNNYTIPGIPKLYGGVLHSVVIEYIDGARLNEIEQVENPINVFEQIIEIIRYIYRNAGIVHGDLSEYNIMLSYKDDKERVYIIDWPQYASINSPLAISMLRRDIENIAKFFRRRYMLEVDVQEVFKYITEQ
ncbi:MAG: RIO1 family regulatory kinase/ATPase [Ignisphaera sp.]